MADNREDRMVWPLSFLHGGTSNLVSTLDTFPVNKTVFRQQFHSTVVSQAIGQLRKEGFLKLYRCVIPLSALPAVAGLGTGVVEALVFTPFERVQNVLQDGNNGRSLPTLRSVLARLGAEKLGMGYYRAVIPILARNPLGSFGYFGRSQCCSEGEGASSYSLILSVRNCDYMPLHPLSMLVVSMPLHPLSMLVVNMQAGLGGVRRSWKALWEGRLKRSRPYTFY
uniref:Solute carrier family 25 member 53 n=1 Tax=Oncorhynchus mykiss TaxID=8022 RepID=A0A8C7WGI8_ONCMY